MEHAWGVSIGNISGCHWDTSRRDRAVFLHEPVRSSSGNQGFLTLTLYCLQPYRSKGGPRDNRSTHRREQETS